MRSVVTRLVLRFSRLAALHWPGARRIFRTGRSRSMVPLAPGGGMDFIARTIGQKLSERLGKPVVVENRPGGGTIVATVAEAKAPPDGYTLLLVPGSTLTTNATVYKSLPYDPRKDFVPIALTSRGGVHAGGQSVAADPFDRRADQIRQGQARRADRRHVGDRDHDPSRRRDSRQQDRHQAPLCALPRQPAGDERRGRRQHPDDVRRSGDRRASSPRPARCARSAVTSKQPHQRVPRYSADRGRRLPATRRPTGTCCWRRRTRRTRSSKSFRAEVRAVTAMPEVHAQYRQGRPAAAREPAARRKCATFLDEEITTLGQARSSRSASPDRCERGTPGASMPI